MLTRHLCPLPQGTHDRSGRSSSNAKTLLGNSRLLSMLLFASSKNSPHLHRLSFCRLVQYISDLLLFCNENIELELELAWSTRVFRSNGQRYVITVFADLLSDFLPWIAY
jgi:hypothetical protein